MISHQHKCVFVHIPKAAGQSIEQVFIDALGLTWATRAPLLLRKNDHPALGPPRLAHLKAGEYARYHYLTHEQFRNYFTFSFVRNPWSRMVSFYRYHHDRNYHDFKTFLLGEFRHQIFAQNMWFYGPQRDMLCNTDGEITVDFVGRFETLKQDFDHVCRKIGLPATPVPHINSAIVRESRKNGRRVPAKKLRGKINRLLRWRPNRHPPRYDRYQEYYDQECVDYVAAIYAADIELFGYSFD